MNLFNIKTKVRIKNLPEKYKDGIRILDYDLTPVELKVGNVVEVTLEAAQVLIERGIGELV